MVASHLLIHRHPTPHERRHVEVHSVVARGLAVLEGTGRHRLQAQLGMHGLGLLAGPPCPRRDDRSRPDRIGFSHGHGDFLQRRRGGGAAGKAGLPYNLDNWGGYPAARSRLLAAIDDGMSCRGAAARFGVAPSTAIRWYAQRRETGSFAPRPQGGDMRSRRVEERSDDILALWAARKDITLEELRTGLAEMGLTVSVAGLHRFFVRRGMTRKKRLAMPSSRTGPMS